MRSSPLSRSTPLRRYTRLRPKRARRLDSARSDPLYLEAVRRLPCCAPMPVHAGPIHAHHAGPKPGTGMKAHDHTAIPLCSACHFFWHNASGPFKGWDKQRRRSWSDQMITQTQVEIAAVQP